jgi:diguanylate cyclase
MKKEVLADLIHFSIIPKNDQQQALRIRRFFMAAAASVLYASLVYVSYLAGFTEWAAIAGFLVIIPVISICLYIFFRTGLNLKMADPSLTAIQMSAAILTVMYVMYYANEARGVLLLSYILIFIFGIFRLSTRDFLLVSGFALLTYGIDIALLHLYRPQGVNFHIEYLQWIVLGLVLASFSIIGGYISRLRQDLTKSKAQQAKYIEVIHEMAIRDELTGFFNRHHFMELLNHEKNRSSRGGGLFCLAMVDIDFFKNVNDTYGHQAGDAVLRTVAAVIRKTLRTTEICGRYGGEEFLVVMTQTDITGAQICAERLRTNIENTLLPELAPDFKVTVSIGLAEYFTREDVEKTISRADEALYRAKRGGRNRVESLL